MAKEFKKQKMRPCNFRKRRHIKEQSVKESNDIVKLHVPSQKPILSEKFSIVVDQSLFKTVYFKSGQHMLRKLLVFTTPEKSFCYEYSWSFKRNQFCCIGCRDKRNSIVAILDNDANKMECIKMEDKKHACTPIQYISEKYILPKIFEKPNYEILDNCNTASGKLLIVFHENDKNLCLEFELRPSMKYFKCRQCYTAAKLCNENQYNEYLELRNGNHQCKFVSYQPKKYYHFNDFVLSPDFEVQTCTMNGNEKKRLIIFDKKNRSLCYCYSILKKNCCYCIRCEAKGLRVSAKLVKNCDGEEYVILSKVKHVCKLRTYSDVLKKKELHLPNRVIKENTENRISKLLALNSEKYAKIQIQKSYDYFYFRLLNQPNSFIVAIYHPEDNRLCYQHDYNTAESFFRCFGCEEKRKFNIIRIQKDENEKEFFAHNYKKHVCQPIKVSTICAPKYVILNRDEINLEVIKKEIPETDRIIKFPNFKLRPNEKGIEDATLFVYHSEDRTMGYKYYCSKGRKYLCQKARVCHASAYIELDANGEKCVVLCKYNHRCTLVESTNETENNILNASQFIIVSQKTNEKITKIIVFTTPERDECYEFTSTNKKNTYVCLGCKTLRKYTALKHCKNENDHEYLKMSKTKHVCEPQKYMKEKYETKTISCDLFQLYSNNRGVADKRLIIFTSEKKDLVYEYCRTYNYSFKCLGCCLKKTNVVAKVIEDRNGKKFVECGSTKHICQP